MPYKNRGSFEQKHKFQGVPGFPAKLRVQFCLKLISSVYISYGFSCMYLPMEFSSESPVLFLYICSIYVATTHLATIFYNKMEQIYLNRTDLLLLNSAFDVTDQKIIW